MKIDREWAIHESDIGCDGRYLSNTEIVRCKDCKWWTKQSDSPQGRCELFHHYPTGGWYCANGRRENETD